MHLCLLIYISTHYLCMPAMAQEIIIGMVNGEQWSYTSCARITCLYVCVRCIRYIYFTLTLYTNLARVSQLAHQLWVLFCQTVNIAALPVYVMDETSVIMKNSPKLVRLWSSFGSWHAHSSMSLMGIMRVLDWVHSVLVNKLKAALHGG